MTSVLLDQARTGDTDAFTELTEPFRRELHVHCYRILGSLHDAEDALQETLLAAWRGLAGFEERASLRTWLYRIATNRCLNVLRSASRQAPMESLFPGLPVPEPTREGEVLWLEPYPDLLLDTITDDRPGPERRYETREAISLAFITALQTLPPRQRAVLILRDVLGFRSLEVASILGCTEESVTSALKRARSSLDRRALSSGAPPPEPHSPEERELLERLTRLYETNDVFGLVDLMTDDVWMHMPPLSLEYQGRDLTRMFLEVVAFRAGREFRLVATRANGQPAFGIYMKDPTAEVFRANGLLVFRLSGTRISALTRFDNSVLPYFALPRTLPDT